MSLYNYLQQKHLGGTTPQLPGASPSSANLARSSSMMSEGGESMYSSLPPRLLATSHPQQISASTLRGESNDILPSPTLAGLNKVPAAPVSLVRNLSTLDSHTRSQTPDMRPPMPRADSMASMLSFGGMQEIPTLRSLPRNGSTMSINGLGMEGSQSMLFSGSTSGYTSVFGETIMEGPLLRSAGAGTWKVCIGRAILAHSGIGGKLLLFKDAKTEHPSDTLDFADVVRVVSGPSAKSTGLFSSSKGASFRYEIKIEGSIPSSFPTVAADNSGAREQWVQMLGHLVPRVTSLQASQLLITNADTHQKALALQDEVERMKHENKEEAKEWKERYNELMNRMQEMDHRRQKAEGELQVYKERSQQPARTTTIVKSSEVPSAQLESMQRSIEALAVEVGRLKSEDRGVNEASLRKGLAHDVASSIEGALENAVDSIVNSMADLLRASSSKSHSGAEMAAVMHQLKQVVEQGSGSVMTALDDVRAKVMAASVAASVSPKEQLDVEGLLSQMKPRLRSLFSDFEATISNKVAEGSKKVTDGLTAMAASNKAVRVDTVVDFKNLATQMKDATKEAFEGTQEQLASIAAAVQRNPGGLTREDLERFSADIARAYEVQLQSQLAPIKEVFENKALALQDNVQANSRALQENMAKASDLAALEARLMPAINVALADHGDRVGQEISRIADIVSSVSYSAPTAAQAVRSPSPTLSMYGDRDNFRLEKMREMVEDAIGEALAEERKRTTSLEKASLALVNDKLATIKTLFEEQVRNSQIQERKTSEPSSPAKSFVSGGADRGFASDARSHLLDIESKVSRLEKESHHLHDIQEGWLKQLTDSMRHLRKDFSELAASERERDRFIRDLTGGSYGNRPVGMAGPPDNTWSQSDAAEMIRQAYVSLSDEIRSLRIGAQPLQIQDSVKIMEDSCVGTETEGLEYLSKEVKALEENALFLHQHVQDLEETRMNLEKEKERQMMELQAILTAKKAAWSQLRQMENAEATLMPREPEVMVESEPVGMVPTSDAGFGSRLRELFELRGAIRNELSTVSLMPTINLSRQASRSLSSTALSAAATRYPDIEPAEEPSGLSSDPVKSNPGKKRVISGKITGLWHKAFNSGSQ